MMKKLLFAAAALLQLVACAEQEAVVPPTNETIYTARVEVAEDECTQTRIYNSDLSWSWQSGDALRGYQLAGHNIRNTLNFIEANASFVCEAFNYMSTDPEAFHFIYPADAEVSEGVLVAPQNGEWRPLSVTTTESAIIESLPTLSFEVLSAALQINIFEEDKATPVSATAAKLTAATDWVGKWTLDPSTMTYEQGFEGTEVLIEGIDLSTVTFIMPDYPAGVEAGFFTLVLTNAEGQTMTRTLPAVSFVKGKRTVMNLVFVPDPENGGDNGGDEPVNPDPEEPITPEPEEPETITGTFTCATYNVDGLPEKVLGFITLNGDGPGEKGTKDISQKVSTSGWDFVAFQENFTYNDELKSAMSNYTFGMHRSFSIVSALGTADTDGLGFATLNATCSFTSETMWAFEHKEGGLTDGANTSIKKGIRHYVVEFDNEVIVDVLITHMNTADNEKQIAAQNGQLQEIAEYINTICSNNRPIIFMGDMNTRYTRNDYQTYFWGVLDSSLTCADPWVEFMWDGVYPTYPSDSIMTSDYGMQRGEVVDKIIYINNSNADTQIKANYYLHDEEYTFADHKPVVSEFTYVKTIQK